MEKRSASFWLELKRRRVVRTAAGYGVVSFVMLQIADATFEALNFPGSAVAVLLAALALGFPVAVLAAWFLESTPDGVILEAEAPTPRLTRRAELLSLFSLFVVSCLFAYVLISSVIGDESGRDTPAVGMTAETARPASTVPSIAVLAFDNLSGNPQDGFLCGGLAEEVTNELAHLPGLKVASRKAAFYYRDKDVELSEVAATLGVDFILEGSVRREDDRLRIAAQLIESVNGYHVWSEIFETRLSSIMNIEKTIARQVALALKISLGQSAHTRLDTPRTQDEDAYLFYLRGSEYLRNSPEEGDLLAAEELFERSLGLDPDFELPAAGLCEVHLARYRQTLSTQHLNVATGACARVAARQSPSPQTLSAMGTMNRMAGNNKEALEFFEEALVITPHSADARSGLAWVQAALGNDDQAEESFKSASVSEPGYYAPYYHYGAYLTSRQRFAEAAVQFRRVNELNPDHINGLVSYGAVLFDLGRWDEAKDVWERAQNMTPNYFVQLNLGTLAYFSGEYELAESYFLQAIEIIDSRYLVWGRLASARREMGRNANAARAKAINLAEAYLALNPNDDGAWAYISSYYLDAGRLQESRKAIARAVALNDESSTNHYFAAIAAHVTKDGTVMEHLRAAVRLGYPVRMLVADPRFKELHSEESFNTLVTTQL